MLTIKVEAQPGSEIEQTFQQAIELSKKLDCWIDFNFNGVHCMANPNGNPKTGAENYHKAIRSNHKYAHS
ncbi:MAG TPA: hypothetical protein VFZ33_16905 [Chitinophagaceae bacterium]